MPKIVIPTLFIDDNQFLPYAGYSVTIDLAIGTQTAFRVIFPNKSKIENVNRIRIINKGQ